MEKKIDTGIYNLNPDKYSELVNDIYSRFPNGVVLDAEYADWIQNNQARLLIRLARYKFVSKMLSSDDDVLEVGSGTGLGSIFLSQWCNSVKGIDVKKTDVDSAQLLNKRHNCSFEVKDFFEYGEKFDAIVALDVIEHFDVNLGERFLKHSSELLKSKNSMVIIGSPSIYSYPYQSPISQASHIKCYDQIELKETMDKYFGRTFAFSMNDEIVHTGNPKMAWYNFIIGVGNA